MRVAIVFVAALLVGAGACQAAGVRATELSIVFYPKGSHVPGARHYTLRCEPAGGTVVNPERACRVLNRFSHPFAPVPPGTICSQIALGPQEATITGRLRGDRVDAHLTVRNSCQIERWRRLASVVPGFPSHN
jgi:hypothetical protein